MKSVLSGGTNAGKTPRALDSASYLSALTASQYAEMFPDYFRRGRPDIGISASGIIPGRQLPSAAAMPGVGQPATAAARAARRAQTSGDQPGTGTSPGTFPGKPKAQQQTKRDAPIWQGGTPEVNRTGELPKRSPGVSGSVDLELNGETDLSKVSVTQRRLAVYNSFRKQGLSHQAAVMLTGEMGRENDFRAALMFGNHKDSGRWNTGIMSWNSDRADMNIDSRAGRRGRLIAHLESKGVMKGNEIVPTQAALDAQVEFLIREMETGTHIGAEGNTNQKAVRVRELLKKMRDPNAKLDYEETHRILGKDLIRWAYDRLPHHRQRMAEHEKALQKEYEAAKKVPDNIDKEDDSYLPDLALLTPEMLKDRKEKEKKKEEKAAIGFGDSVMNQILDRNKSIQRGFTRDGAAPKEIYGQIKAYDRDSLKGKKVYLSTGLLNDPKDTATVREMITYVAESGGEVVLIGGPNEAGARDDLKGVHDTLAKIAEEKKVSITAPYSTKDKVHMSKEALNNLFPSEPQQTGPIRTEGLPSAPNIRNKSPEELSQIFPENSQRFFHEGGGRDVNPKLIEVMKEASRDLPPGYHVRMFSGRDARVTGTKNHPGGVAVDVAIVDDKGRRLADRGFGEGHKIYEQLAHSMNMRGRQMYPETNWIWGGSWTAAGGDRMHYQIADPDNVISGATRGMTQYSWERGVESDHWAGRPDAWMNKDELREYKKKIAEKIGRELTEAEVTALNRQNAVNAPTATPINMRGITQGIPRPQILTDEPYKLMFNTSRAYTENEVLSMIREHGKNLIIGANMDSPDEYEKVRLLAEKYGLKMHGYSKGRGAPQSSWGNQFPNEQKEIQALAKERGISLNQWYNGGWMDYEIDRLRALGKNAPSQIELDNFNDARTSADFEKELKKYADSGLSTRIVPKNWGEKEYSAYNRLVKEKQIRNDLVIPLNLVETKYVKNNEKITEAAGHAYGNLPDANVDEYKTSTPITQPAVEQVKQNNSGGKMQVYNSKESTFLVNEGGVIGSVAPGESISYNKSGQVEVIPGHRTDPNAITDNSRKLADAARHASTMAQDDYNVEGTASMVQTQQYQSQYQVGRQNINPEAPFAPSFGRLMARSSDITKIEDHFSNHSLNHNLA